MNADSRLALIRTKSPRARVHLVSLQGLIEGYLAGKPYEMSTREDTAAEQRVYFISAIGEPPPEIALLLGEILQNLRSALDHLAYQLCLVGGGTERDLRRVQFPIAETTGCFKRQLPAQTAGMTDAAVRTIIELRPHRGGNEWLLLLHRLNNIDKHRTLVISGGRAAGIDVLGLIGQALREGFEPDTTLFLRPADDGFPLSVGSVMLREPLRTKPHDQLVKVELAFNEPDLRTGLPLADTLGGLVRNVEAVIESFRPHLG